MCRACKLREYYRAHGRGRPARRVDKVSDEELSRRIDAYWERVKVEEYQERQERNSLCDVIGILEGWDGSFS